MERLLMQWLAGTLATVLSHGAFAQVVISGRGGPDSEPSEPISYDLGSAMWLFDEARLVGHNDVIYTGPATLDWHAMPTGGGDLWALVRCDGDLHLRLYKSDYFGGCLASVRVAFGAQGKSLISKGFLQRLDLYRGKVRIRLGEAETGPSIEVWGHPARHIIIIEISDPEALLGPSQLTLDSPTKTAGRTGATLWAKEVHRDPAGPGLANTGMQAYFSEADDPMLDRGAAVVVGTPSSSREGEAAYSPDRSMALPQPDGGAYHIVIAGEVTEKADPLRRAQRTFEDACSESIESLKQEHQAWWEDYWSNSFLCLASTDHQADWLTAAYHLHLYTLGCLNRGKYPHRYDGGGPILDWVQEVRFIFSPLYAANRMEMARALPDAFTRMSPYMERQTRNVWGVDGLWVPECYYPWGHTDDVVLKDDGRDRSWLWHERDPERIPYGLFELYNNHTGLIFTSGLEIGHHYLTYYRYSGDEDFLRDQTYPFLRDVCEFIGNILRKEDDGLYHLDPANALETWWEVRDPADTLDGIRCIFPEFIRLSERYGCDEDLRAKCWRILDALPTPSIGKWYDDGRVAPDIDAYAPAADKHRFPNRINAENPALYRVYPFALSGIGSPDFMRAKRTFQHRTSPLWFGWAMDAIWAARLGLDDEACTLLVEHARRFNVFPYGGWHFSAHTPHDKPYPHNRDFYTKPFLDAGGCSATALNEILLQSHGGVIRVAPALSSKWSGIYRLRAEGGFLVASDIQRGSPRFVEIRSLLGKRCRVENPWGERCVVRKGEALVHESAESEVAFDTDANGIYVLERASRPVSSYSSAPLDSREQFWRPRGYRHCGLPGRD